LIVPEIKLSRHGKLKIKFGKTDDFKSESILCISKRKMELLILKYSKNK
jgi:hypothetical protein